MTNFTFSEDGPSAWYELISQRVDEMNVVFRLNVSFLKELDFHEQGD